MSELMLNPGAGVIASGDKQIVVPVPSVPGVRSRGEPRSRRRFNARLLQTSDGGFRLFRIY